MDPVNLWEVIFHDEFDPEFDAHHGTQVWRAAFAFDPQRNAIVLAAAAKQGTNEQKFYKALLKKANQRYDSHLRALKQEAAVTRISRNK